MEHLESHGVVSVCSNMVQLINTTPGFLGGYHVDKEKQIISACHDVLELDQLSSLPGLNLSEWACLFKVFEGFSLPG